MAKSEVYSLNHFHNNVELYIVEPNGGQEMSQGHRPRCSSPSPQGAKYNTITEDTSPSGVADVCDKYLFGRAKTGSLGLVTKKKRRPRKPEMGNTRPSPNDGVKSYYFN